MEAVIDANQSLVGEFAEAWRTMLASYDQNSDWPLEECLVDATLDKCPGDKKHTMEFPEALAKHLVKTGYITAEQMRGLKFSAPAQSQDRPWGGASLMDVCKYQGNTVRKLILNVIVGKRETLDMLGDFITLHDDFTVNGNNPTINKVTCAVSYELNLRGMIGKLAENGQMRTANALNDIVRRRGGNISARVSYTVQPTSKPGQTWIQLQR